MSDTSSDEAYYTSWLIKEAKLEMLREIEEEAQSEYGRLDERDSAEGYGARCVLEIIQTKIAILEGK